MNRRPHPIFKNYVGNFVIEFLVRDAIESQELLAQCMALDRIRVFTVVGLAGIFHHPKEIPAFSNKRPSLRAYSSSPAYSDSMTDAAQASQVVGGIGSAA